MENDKKLQLLRSVVSELNANYVADLIEFGLNMIVEGMLRSNKRTQEHFKELQEYVNYQLDLMIKEEIKLKNIK